MCLGCYWQLRGAFKESDKGLHYSLEEILWAFGDGYPVPLEERFQIMKNMFDQKMQESKR